MLTDTRPWWLRFLIHHNPFYLLSAACMFSGCYALNHALALTPGQLGKLLTVVGVVNVYEVMVIALGLFLVARRGLLADARSLLLIASLFLVDATFLNAEIAATDVWLGAGLNLLLLGLAMAKVLTVIRVAKMGVPVRQVVFLLAQLTLLFALPVVFKWWDRNGGIEPVKFYGAWWAVGLVPLMYDLLVPRREPSLARWPWHRPVLLAYVGLPFGSLIAHISVSHWIYQTPFFMANLAPVLLA